MQSASKINTFNALRKKHPTLIYESFNILQQNDFITITFLFRLPDKCTFHPSYTFPIRQSEFAKINDTALQNLTFHLGMIEMLSYWKAACPPQVIIRPAFLNAQQLTWWKNLWFKGLGEFFYLNGIEVSEDDFVNFICESDSTFSSFNFDTDNKIIVPVGGGKDSAVSLELLKNSGMPVIPLMINPSRAGIDTIRKAGFADEDLFAIKRKIDPALLRLNAEGYLNGHTPFSAMVAFTTLIAAKLTGICHIALSNESSASEATIPGTLINHQYSKSLTFERDFREYVAEFISSDFNYFSFLRPLNELQIARFLAGFPQHLPSFRSCNVGSKQNRWCGHCPKCLFTAIMLAPFVEGEKLKAIFAKDMLDDAALMRTLDQLSGLAAEKPFECVGTIGEVEAALKHLIEVNKKDKLPALLAMYKERMPSGESTFEDHLHAFDEQHFLSSYFVKILKQALL